MYYNVFGEIWISKEEFVIAKIIKLKANGLEKIPNVDERLVSYNVEITEVTCGTFWKEYSPEAIASKGKPIIGIKNYDSMMQVYPPPIDLTNPSS